VLVLAAALVVVGEILTWFLLRSQGNDLGGDQAHYLIASQALGHLSLHPLPEYSRDFLTHFVYNWPGGASIANHSIVQTYPGPHGSIFGHGLGLPLLLSPFIALGSVPLGLVGLFSLTALGYLCIHQRGSRLAGLSRRGQWVFALALAAPAVWLQSTQVYPDLLSGVLLAAALVEIALAERHRRMSGFGAVVIAVGLAFVPWLQIKNLAPAVCCLIALAAISRHLLSQRRLLVAMVAVIVAGWVLLFAYNQYYFGHLVGLPQPNPTFTLTSVTRVAALVFDRHQGLLVQVPTVIVGACGLWISRRTIPWAAGAAAVGALSMLVINGTYTSNVPYGGAALAGRFEWTVGPMLMAWAPFVLARIDLHRIRMAGVAAAVGALWVVQAVPILTGNHTYINALIAPFAPWDPSLYPGWWPGLSQYLPTFLPPGFRLAATWTHLLFELVIVAAITLTLVGLMRSVAIPRRTLATSLAALTLVAVLVIALGPSRAQPPGPLSWSGAVIGAPWSTTGPTTTFAPIELIDVGPGTYRASLVYASQPGAAPARATLLTTPVQRSVVSHWLSVFHPTDAALLSVTAPPLDLTGEQTSTVTLRASGAAAPRRTTVISITAHQASVLSFQMEVRPGGAYDAVSLTVRKVAS
jgi:hypothetical protein